MRKLIAILLALALLPTMALAEFNTQALMQEEDFIVMMRPGSWDTLYCPMNQPYPGEAGDAWMDVSVDFVELVDIDMTLVRVSVRVEVFDNLYADTITFTVGGKRYAFAVQADVFEYDGVYQETYDVCLTDASLPFLKAIAQRKKDDPIPVEFLSGGQSVLTGRVVIPGDDAARIYDLFIDLDGKSQDLKSVDGMWPCEITKVK